MERLKSDLESLGKIGKDPKGGVSRPALSEPDIEARLYVIEKMKEAKLKVYVDQGGNIIGLREGKVKEPFITTGSHIDTVLNGGMFDGALGVLGGLEAIRELNEDRVQTKLPIALVVFTDEEGNAFMPFAGSKYFAGLIDKSTLHAVEGKYEKISFGNALERFLKRSNAGVIERFSSTILSHLELHVEQGPILEVERKQIGVVTGIVGVHRIWMNFNGKQAHAGTTPMNMRSDPMISASATVTKVREIVLGRGKDLVGTVGYFQVSPNVVNVIAGSVRIGIDIRSLSRNDMLEVGKEVIDYARNVSEKEGVRLNYETYIENPAMCDETIVKTIEESVIQLGYQYMKMPSRAVHDSQVMSEITKIGMIFVPSKGGISHAPDEWTDFEDAYKGVEVLKLTLLKLAGS
ncbi:Zn-dependent hydrolase [Stygiolobus caldivivus]|uniref:Zn-dependent hydrolase n=1 Tax=Stygiolobus caldivivus TaxID=2824673 RepID=A0A8D5U9D0_9CREN|nr:Zn-dependent hydrolase [Stygiolobus caldivivus]BCU71652.1 Zn-dependent hydrolase [Stygiolobus caldivivus]